MKNLRISIYLLVSSMLVTTLAFSQDYKSTKKVDYIKLAGPRAGVTYLPAKPFDIEVANLDTTQPMVISQFGWQFEKRFLNTGDGPAALLELVLLAGGMDRGLFLPSGNFLVGVRSVEGFEVGVGPNLSLAGVGLSVASGYTFKLEQMYVPVNLAVTKGESGARMSILVGFNMRNK